MRYLNIIIGVAGLLPACCGFALTLDVPFGVLPDRAQPAWQNMPPLPKLTPIIVPSESPQKTDMSFSDLSDLDDETLIDKGDSIQKSAPLILKRVILSGNTVFSKQALYPLYAGYLNKAVSQDNIQTIADAITKKYRAAGYMLSQAVVQQTVKLPARSSKQKKWIPVIGRIKVIEGAIRYVDISGSASKRFKALLANYARTLLKSHPLRSAVLERYLLLMRDLPGAQIKAWVETRHDPAHSVLKIVAGRRYYRATLRVDNHAVEALGSERFTLGMHFNGLLGMTTQTGYRIAIDPRVHRLQAFQINHKVFIGSSGGQLHFSFQHINVKPDLPNPSPLLDGRAQRFMMHYDYPIRRSHQSNILIDIGVKALNSEVDTAMLKLYNNKTRLVYAGLRYNGRDTYLGLNTLGVHVWQGLDMLGAAREPHLSRLGAKPNFTKITANLSRLQMLGTYFSGLIAIHGQFSFDPLVVSEALGFGGYAYGLGYESSDIIGDHGIVGKTELRLDTPFDYRFLRRVQWFANYSIGVVWNRRPLTIMLPNHLSGSSLGIGARIRFSRYLTGKLSIAETLTRDNCFRRPGKMNAYFDLMALLS